MTRAATPDLKSDCTKCAGLCCAAFAFERSDMFSIDKAVDEACPHLDMDFGCAIHAQRPELGFRGCTMFDCHGAGQRVTQEIFPEKNWRDDPSIATPMFDAFRKMLRIHDYLRLLIILEALPLDDVERCEVARFHQILAPEGGWDRESLERFEEMRVITEFELFAAGLKDSPAARTLKARFVHEGKLDS